MKGAGDRYFFHRRLNGKLLEDVEGSELDDRSAAIAEALTFARHLWADAIVRGEDISADRFEITDEQGRSIAIVPFTDALPPSLRPIPAPDR